MNKNEVKQISNGVDVYVDTIMGLFASSTNVLCEAQSTDGNWVMYVETDGNPVLFCEDTAKEVIGLMTNPNDTNDDIDVALDIYHSVTNPTLKKFVASVLDVPTF